jgi:hypothetical protein
MIRRVDGPFRQLESEPKVEHGQYLPLHIDRSEHDVRRQR